MNSNTLRLTALSVSTAILFTGCEGMTPGESGAAVGASAGAIAGAIGAAAGLHTGEAAALGAGVGLLTGVITYAIAKHQADERQKQVAEANARRAYAAHQSELKRKKVRYIAVKTSRNKDSKGASSCMVYDTEKKELVNDTVYDTKTTPPKGSTAKFDSYSAEYVSS